MWILKFLKLIKRSETDSICSCVAKQNKEKEQTRKKKIQSNNNNNNNNNNIPHEREITCDKKLVGVKREREKTKMQQTEKQTAAKKAHLQNCAKSKTKLMMCLIVH